MCGTVKLFNVKKGYGFINHNGTREDIFVHQSVITKNNPQKTKRSVGEGESVEFSIMKGAKGMGAVSVTGSCGAPVQGSPYAPDRRPVRTHWFPRRAQLPPVINSRRGPRNKDSSDAAETQRL